MPVKITTSVMGLLSLVWGSINKAERAFRKSSRSLEETTIFGNNLDIYKSLNILEKKLFIL